MDAEALVFVIDDDAPLRESLQDLMQSVGLRVAAFASAQEFLRSPRPEVPGCLVLDVRLPGLSGLELQQRMAEGDREMPIIFITGHGDIPMTVRAMKAGAIEFLTKPCRDEDLLHAVEQAITRSRQLALGTNQPAAEQPHTDDELRRDSRFSEIVGHSAALRRVLQAVETVAPTEATVLPSGETGTGKDVIARALHALSGRRQHPFVKLNCAAIPTGLLESELFGHEKGAFTGAIAPRMGRFELAHRGTLLLDEIGDLPLELQPKLLRVLQERAFERLGGTRTVHTDARLIAATNADLAQLVAEKRFRRDLYYRLHVFPIVMPPLRERREDIPLLVRYFVHTYARRLHKRIETIPPAAMTALTAYDWPGNVRELEHFIERAVILSREPELQPPLAELSPHLPSASAVAGAFNGCAHHQVDHSTYPRTPSGLRHHLLLGLRCHATSPAGHRDGPARAHRAFARQHLSPRGGWRTSTFVRHALGSPWMHSSKEPPWRVETARWASTFEQENAHLCGVTLLLRASITPHQRKQGWLLAAFGDVVRWRHSGVY